MKKINHKGFEPVWLLILLLVLIVLGGAGYYVWQRNQDESASESVDSEATSGVSDAGTGCTATADYSVYDNTDVRFCFIYPEVWGEVTLHEGILDPALEEGSGYYGTFSDEENASFAFQSDDWAYTGPGRGGPNHATGFTAYEIFTPSAGDTTNYSIKVNTAEKQLVAATTMFNFEGVTIWAKRPFVESEPYVGIEFQMNIPSTDPDFDYETVEPDDFVTDTEYEQMTTVLDSVTEY